MTELDEHTITAEVLERLEGTQDPRLQEICASLVRHLHDFAREVELTPEEWMAGIEFLTRVGHMCTPNRQEFVLLSDTLGVSMLVDMLAHRDGEEVTESTILGPFYVEDAPLLPPGSDLADGTPGRPLLVEGTVQSDQGEPLAGATVETWQSDAEGYYDVQVGDELKLRGRFTTDEAGQYTFWTIVPSHYPIPDDGPVGDMLRAQGRHPNRPAHIHFKVTHPHHRELVTHLFVDGDPYLDSDAVFGVRRSLIQTLEDRTGAPDDERPDEYAFLSYDFVLAAGERPAGG